MKIKPENFDAILDGSKTLEIRVGYPAIRRLHYGSIVTLNSTDNRSTTIRILAVRIYRSFEEMLRNEDWRLIRPDARSREEALKKMRAIYPSTKEQLGVYVLQVTPYHKT